MSRWAFIITKANREKLHKWLERAPDGYRMELKEPSRTTDQNAKMWACLTDVATQVTHHGIKLSADDWKLLMMDALKREVRMVPNIDGNGLVSLGRSSSDLSKQEMSDLIELIHAFGAQHGVTFHEPEAAPSEPQKEPA